MKSGSNFINNHGGGGGGGGRICSCVGPQTFV